MLVGQMRQKCLPHTFSYALLGNLLRDRIVTRDGFDQGPQILQKSGSYVQIPSARRVTWSECHNEDHCFWSGQWTWSSSGALCSMNVNWYTFLYIRKNYSVYAENMRLYGSKLVSLGDQSGICARLMSWIIFWNLQANLHICRICCNVSRNLIA